VRKYYILVIFFGFVISLAHYNASGAYDSVVGCGTMQQDRRLQVRNLTRSLNFSVYLFLPAALGPPVYSASSRNEYQKEKKNVSRE
jgi:hypothetical protein